MTDTEAVEAMKARHLEELAEWRTRCERAEADNAALVEQLRAYHSTPLDPSDPYKVGRRTQELLAQPHPGDAQRERLRQAEQERDEWKAKAEAVWRAKEDNERFAEEQERAAVEAARQRDELRARAEKAEQECTRLRGELSASRAACKRGVGRETGVRVELERLRAQLTAAREEGRREGLEQAATLADCRCTPPPGATGDWHSMCCTVRLARDIRALAAQPAQEDPRQDEPPDTDMEEILAMTPAQVHAELRKAGVDPEAFSKRCGALVERIRARQSEPSDTAALFAAVRAMLGHIAEDGREEAKSALSALEQRMGAMVLVLHDAAGCDNADNAHACHGACLGCRATVALTSAPPVFTLEEVEAAILDAAAAHDMAALRKRAEDECTDVAVTDGFTAGANCALEAVRRLLERAGGKP